MMSFFKVEKREQCEGTNGNPCTVKTKGRLSFMGTDKLQPICSKCFRIFMKPWNTDSYEEYDY